MVAHHFIIISHLPFLASSGWNVAISVAENVMSAAVISGNQRQSVAIRGNPLQSVAISGQKEPLRSHSRSTHLPR